MAAPDAPEAARAMAMALTHDDTFKAVPGYKTFVNHFHLAFTDRTRGALDTPLQDLVAMKALGLNIIGLSDFHFELQDGASDVGPIRFREQREYFEASRHASDADFLVAPWEEPSAFFGGHYNLMGPKPQYWAKVRQEPRRLRTAVLGNRSDLRQDLPHGQRGRRAEVPGRDQQLLVHRASAHQELERLPRCVLEHVLRQERPVPRPRLQAGHGAGSVRGHALRVAVLRRHRHDEQPERGLGCRAQVPDRRRRHLQERTGRRPVCRLSGQLPEAREDALVDRRPGRRFSRRSAPATSSRRRARSSSGTTR